MVNTTFIHNELHILRTQRLWKVPNVRTVKYGTETMRYIGPKTWDILPKSIKLSKSLTEFKRKVKLWKPEECTCRLCKIYITNLGFL